MPDPLDDGPFFHGTVADLRPGQLLTSGRRSNYRPCTASTRPGIVTTERS